MTPPKDDSDQWLDEILGEYPTWDMCGDPDCEHWLAFQDAITTIKKEIDALVIMGRIDELKRMCRKHWQLPIPERAMLDRIKELSDLTQDKEE